MPHTGYYTITDSHFSHIFFASFYNFITDCNKADNKIITDTVDPGDSTNQEKQPV